MKTIFSFLSLIFLAFAAFAQSPYSGGNGGGYAMAGWKVPLILKEDVQISPSLVTAGGSIRIDMQDIKNKFEIRIVDLLGHILKESEEFGRPGEQIRYVIVPDLAQGIYLLDVRRDGRQSVFRIMVTQ